MMLLYINTTWIHGLTHWGRVAHICVGNLIISGSGNVFSPGRGQASIWINDGILLRGSLRTNVNEILIQMYIFSFMKILLKMSSTKCRSFCLGLNVLILPVYTNILLGCQAGMAVVVIDILNPQFVCFCTNRFARLLHVRFLQNRYQEKQIYCLPHGPLARYANLRVRMRRECRERFPRHHRQAIPTCITARASRTCRDACRDR